MAIGGTCSEGNRNEDNNYLSKKGGKGGVTVHVQRYFAPVRQFYFCPYSCTVKMSIKKLQRTQKKLKVCTPMSHSILQ